MAISRLLMLSAVALGTLTETSYAGPCSPEIDRMQARVDALFAARAAAGPAARESTDARMHHQPTPGSVAAAERSLGETSSKTKEDVASAIAAAREADRVGDRAACDRALVEVQRAIGP